MEHHELRTVARLDAPRVVAAITAAGGPSVELVRPLAGGAVGAWLVRRAGGGLSVLTWSPPPPPGVAAGAFGAARTLMGLARAAGVPTPRDEDVIALADGGVALLQEHLPGVPPSTASAALVDRVVELAELRRGLLRDTRFADEPCPLHLTTSGPGFCHHEPLRRHSAETRSILDRIEAIGAELGDSLTGDDLVHFDYTLGNVLVDEHDPHRVVGVVDWDGARAGDLVLDLVVLRFDLSWRAPDVGDRLGRQVVEATDERAHRLAWAHVSLRLIDWTIRHQPEAVDHWTTLARRHL